MVSPCVSVSKTVIVHAVDLVILHYSYMTVLYLDYILHKIHTQYHVLTLLTLAVLLNPSVSQRASLWLILLVYSLSDPALSDVRSLTSELWSEQHSLYLLFCNSLTWRQKDNSVVHEIMCNTNSCHINTEIKILSVLLVNALIHKKHHCKDCDLHSACFITELLTAVSPVYTRGSSVDHRASPLQSLLVHTHSDPALWCVMNFYRELKPNQCRISHLHCYIVWERDLFSIIIYSVLEWTKHCYNIKVHK